MAKPILCLDFDGVIHSYSSGWKGADVISDLPVEGAIAFMLGALDKFDVVIFSSRSNQKGGIQAMRSWLKTHAGNAWNESPCGPGIEDVRFVMEKPPALVTIDDRALTFTGKWPTLDELASFKPWNKLAPTKGADDSEEKKFMSWYVDAKRKDLIADYEFHGAKAAWQARAELDSLRTQSANAQPVAGEEPVLWWNGFRKDDDERDGVSGPSFSPVENTWHDIPLIAGINPCNLATRDAAPIDAQDADADLIPSLHRTIELLLDELEAARATADRDSADAWQTIETAPKTGRTLLLGYPNSLGKWRMVRGQWMTQEYINQNWEEPDEAEAGWYETSVEADDVPNCWPITPTHWQPLPTPPAIAAVESQSGKGESNG